MVYGITISRSCKKLKMIVLPPHKAGDSGERDGRKKLLEHN